MAEVTPSARRTGLLVPVREADPLVGDFRRRHNAESVARRMPPHVTVLFPFARAAAVDDDLLHVVSSHFAGIAGFEAEMGGVGRFDDYVWLAPLPHDRWVQLLSATWARFPEYPPYEGQPVEPEPHLTIAAVDGAVVAARLAAEAELELGTDLLLRFEVDGVSLFEEQGDGTWRETTRFPLG